LIGESSVFVSGTMFFSDARQAALDFRTVGFGRDLDGLASGFTSIEPLNESKAIVIRG